MKCGHVSPSARDMTVNYYTVHSDRSACDVRGRSDHALALLNCNQMPNFNYSAQLVGDMHQCRVLSSVERGKDSHLDTVSALHF